jgi:hypothetical protein
MKLSTQGGSSSLVIQSYEHYSLGHNDLRGPAYKHIDLVISPPF